MFRYWLVVILAVIVGMPAVVSAEEIVMDKILVKVNDDIITQYDLDERIQPILDKVGDRALTEQEQAQLDALRSQTLEQMINDALLDQEIEKYGIDVSDEIVDKEISRIKEQRGFTEEDFQGVLEQDGVTLEEFRGKLKTMMEKQEVLRYMVHNKVLVTDTEIKEDYEAHRDDYVLEKMVELAIILLPSDVSAVEVKKRIEDGEMTFAEAAARYSVGPGKDEGGSIGELSWSDLAEEWTDSLAGVPAGGVGTPLVVQGKEALLSPIKIMEDRLVPLEDVRDRIYERLLAAKRESVFEGYFEQLKQESVIVYMD